MLHCRCRIWLKKSDAGGRRKYMGCMYYVYYSQTLIILPSCLFRCQNHRNNATPTQRLTYGQLITQSACNSTAMRKSTGHRVGLIGTSGRHASGTHACVEREHYRIVGLSLRRTE